ncbi:CpaF family protein [Candidatus Woesearchaeota archaeon]|nr:CpaF family protein [Candidatus Woesearchaeota archaeon]
MESYNLSIGGVVVDVHIYQEPEESVPTYNISILNISRTTSIILNKIREEFISRINVGSRDLGDDTAEDIKERFKEEIMILIKKYFPNIDDKTADLLMNHVIQQNIGLGNLEILLKDKNLEEIVVNSCQEPVWVFHRSHGWLKTNVLIPSEARIRHYATMIGRDVGKEITLLKPLMDASLKTGDRVNATLLPISTKGNTITIRKFSEKPWSITDLIKCNTLSFESAAFVWLAIQNELSMIVAGGTGSGKTSTLNAIANFFPANQRIISIEDTRELTLPKNLHWVPMETRLPNPEGKGEVSMLDLVINSLRMRPDRILVGEIRRQREAEVLFEAMHTGHSVYGTFHANNARETITRLTNPPINVPRHVLGSLSLILVQNRNRRTGFRRTLQLAEVNESGEESVIMQLNVQKDSIVSVKEPKRVYETLELYSGLSQAEILKDLESKTRVLKWMAKNDMTDVHKIGLVVMNYYAGKFRV